MNKILLAFDGSEPAKRALDQTAELAKALGASVTVLTVMPVERGREVMPFDDRDLHTDEIVEARALLHERGVDAELVERPGDAAEMILRLAAEGRFDTIVVGSRGLGTVDRVLLGSVSTHVATNAEATVIVVH